MIHDIRKALEISKRDLKETRDEKMNVEKECVVYKTQLEVMPGTIWRCGLYEDIPHRTFSVNWSWRGERGGCQMVKHWNYCTR